MRATLANAPPELKRFVEAKVTALPDRLAPLADPGTDTATALAFAWHTSALLEQAFNLSLDAPCNHTLDALDARAKGQLVWVAAYLRGALLNRRATLRQGQERNVLGMQAYSHGARALSELSKRRVAGPPEPGHAEAELTVRMLLYDCCASHGRSAEATQHRNVCIELAKRPFARASHNGVAQACRDLHRHMKNKLARPVDFGPD